MAANIEIEWIGGNCPVQAEGTVDGKPFYFRARGESWSMEIGRPDRQPEWQYRESYGEEQFEAGWMDEEEARSFIAKAAEMYLAETTVIVSPETSVAVSTPD